jgi:hypothetical protein
MVNCFRWFNVKSESDTKMVISGLTLFANMHRVAITYFNGCKKGIRI